MFKSPAEVAAYWGAYAAGFAPDGFALEVIAVPRANHAAERAEMGDTVWPAL